MSWTRDSYASAAGPDPITGTLTCYTQPFNQDSVVWRLAIAGPKKTFAYVYVGQKTQIGQVAEYEDVSYWGQTDSADWPNGLQVRSGQVLAVLWYSVAADLNTPVAITNPLVADAKISVSWEATPDPIYEAGGGVTETRRRYLQ